jgi:hypothetical protein
MNTEEIMEKLAVALDKGPLSLGDLRRQHGLEATAIEQTVNHYPERFEWLTLGIKPAVKLRTKLSDKDLRKFILLKNQQGGLGLARWKQTHKFTPEETRDFALRFSDAVTIINLPNKTGTPREVVILKCFETLHSQTPAVMPQTVSGPPEGSAFLPTEKQKHLQTNLTIFWLTLPN